MKVTLSLLYLLMLLPLPLRAEVQVVWGTDVWEGYTEPDGSGFYQELMALIFPAENFDLHIEYLAWQRVAWNLKRRNIDMTGALHQTDEYHLSVTPVLSERILAVSRNGVALDLDSPSSLNTLVGAYRNGYEDDIFHEIIPTSVPSVAVDSPLQAMTLLRGGKVDYYIELESLLNRHHDVLATEDLRVSEVGSFELFWAFAKSQKGLYLKAHFDKTYARLRKSGKLARLYQRYRLTLPSATTDTQVVPDTLAN